IAIAHRLTTLQNADRIIVMDQGRIVEEGDHDALMRRGGQYARMVRMQRGVEATPDGVAAELLRQEHDERARAAQLPAGTGLAAGAGRAEGGAAQGAERVAQPGELSGEDQPDALAPLGSHHPRWLSPSVARVHLGTFETLHVSSRGERSYGGVRAVRCLPVHFPREYISLRYTNAEGHEVEIGLMRRLDDWPAEAQQLVSESLQR